MLVDTSGILCLASQAEKFHARAVAKWVGAGRRVTHNYVLSEWVPLATTRGIDREDTLRWLDVIATAPGVEFVHVDDVLHAAAVTLLRSRLDKAWSLCDAVSFVLMTRLGITNALTADHHFTQAGFRRLLG